MGLSSKRESRLASVLTAKGFAVDTRTTLPMAYGDSVETTVWHLTGPHAVTLCLVTEVGMDGFFPPVLRAVRGHLTAAEGKDAAGVEFVWDDEGDAPLTAFVEQLRNLA